MFNQYYFISNLKAEIKSEKPEDLISFIFEKIENEIIYYFDCFEICKELNFTHFEEHEFGPITDICKAAFCALYDLCINNYIELEQANEEEQI